MSTNACFAVVISVSLICDLYYVLCYITLRSFVSIFLRDLMRKMITRRAV